jgi:hypothetical protein
MNVEIGTETPIFLFWEYLVQIFGILSLQCIWFAYPPLQYDDFEAKIGKCIILAGKSKN